MKRIIMYHDDADGRCAAAIAGRDALLLDQEPKYYPIQYGDPIPWEMLDKFEKDLDEFWLLDFSLPVPEMTLIHGEVGKNFVWIDHHVTQIERLKHFQGLKGIRDPQTAACLLTWRFCHSPQQQMHRNIRTSECIEVGAAVYDPVPPAVRYIADRDMWQFEYGNATRYFYEIFKLERTRPEEPIWDTWLGDMDISLDLAAGQKLYEARIRMLRGYAKSLGIEAVVRIDGEDFKGLRVNYPGSGDMGQVIKDLGYAVAHCYTEQVKAGRMVRIHNMYSDVANVGDFAKAMGGGGHKAAAGWVEEVL